MFFKLMRSIARAYCSLGHGLAECFQWPKPQTLPTERYRCLTKEFFIARVESAGLEDLAHILTRPSFEEEKALRAHLGNQRYQRMHSMALKRNVSRSLERKKKGNVIVIHGIMGAELAVGSSGGGSWDLTWVNAFRIRRTRCGCKPPSEA
jgi:hypothetical protein